MPMIRDDTIVLSVPNGLGNLNEVIVSEGRRFNIPTPYNEAVSWLTRGVEERNRHKRYEINSAILRPRPTPVRKLNINVDIGARFRYPND